VSSAVKTRGFGPFTLTGFAVTAVDRGAKLSGIRTGGAAIGNGFGCGGFATKIPMGGFDNDNAVGGSGCLARVLVAIERETLIKFVISHFSVSFSAMESPTEAGLNR
jgi:hypothetical protein